jgi:hypothetical protein
VFPRSGFELYGEWARNDHSWDWRDFVLEPGHAGAGLLGFQKVLRTEPGTWTMRGEIVSMAKGVAAPRHRPPWYAHHVVTQGYTSQGQLVGAAIGPDSNRESLAVDFCVGRWGVGGSAQRLQRDLDDVAWGFAVQSSVAYRGVRMGGLAEYLVERNRYALGRSAQSLHLAIRAEAASW